MMCCVSISGLILNPRSKIIYTGCCHGDLVVCPVRNDANASREKMISFLAAGSIARHGTEVARLFARFSTLLGPKLRWSLHEDVYEAVL